MNTLCHTLLTPAALALGSNIGNAGEIFDQACDLLMQNHFQITARANIILTAPVDCPPGTPDFANSALTGFYSGSAEELLELTQSIEVALGRPADHGFHTPRTLDLDIILFGDTIMQTPRLTLPHPRACERKFVLEPLCSIAPDWLFPDTKKSIRQALACLDA